MHFHTINQVEGSQGWLACETPADPPITTWACM